MVQTWKPHLLLQPLSLCWQTAVAWHMQSPASGVRATASLASYWPVAVCSEDKGQASDHKCKAVLVSGYGVVPAEYCFWQTYRHGLQRFV
jgi:hypothetical protein